MRTINLVILTAVLAVTAITTFAADPVGTIVSFTGKATAVSQNGESRNLALKSPVFLNDRIKTDEASSLQIMFLDDSLLSQGEKSEMTIDEYVYNPAVKKDNKCTFKLATGVFRVVTARITTLNPDRFKVKTRLATIGIRGCELAFVINQASENIYVLSLPDGKSIIITIDPAAAAGMNLTGILNKEAAIELIQAGVMVSIQEGEGVTQRLITPQEAIDLIEDLSAPGQPGGSTPPPGGGGTGGGTGGGLNDNTLNNLTGSANQDNNEGELEETQQQLITQLQNSQTTTTGGGSSSTTPTTTAPAPTLAYTKMGPMIAADWEWGVWGYPAAVPMKVDFKAASLLSDADVQSLFPSYQMNNGMGESGAIVTHNGTRYFVRGSCNLNVDMMTGAPGTWSVSGTLVDSGETAQFVFNIDGSVLGTGKFTGSVTSGSLQVPGNSYGAPDAGSSAGASLMGSGGIPSGIIGKYDCTFGSGAASVSGGFGGPAVVVLP
ncbi:MAG: FecR domain-containing protein [Kiritimatiellae bacterium]|nr:FecR domain-containing protein [Kiritimatiellia bacterium]MDD5520152.1 FecR domain-containing protein [Kiritimatiellia bacterium]